MLRASAMTNQTDVNLQAVNGEVSGADIGITYGMELMNFAQSVASRNESDLVAARQTLLDVAGPAVLVDAAGVAANFQRMVRIADSMGIPVDDMQTELGQQVRQELNLGRFTTAQNSVATQ
tara:strand:+ start:7093 stop:7455 length:363 start_codon:yes stop_codon:yes gene_type:complete